VGVDPSGSPIIQPVVLSAGNCLDEATHFIRNFARIHTTENWSNASLDYLCNKLGAEFYTILAVARHHAYYPGLFDAQEFADTLQEPIEWIGKSYYRLGNLVRSTPQHSSPSYLQSVIRVLCATEALEVYASLTQTDGAFTLMDPDVFARESGEDSHDSL